MKYHLELSFISTLLVASLACGGTGQRSQQNEGATAPPTQQAPAAQKIAGLSFGMTAAEVLQVLGPVSETKEAMGTQVQVHSLEFMERKWVVRVFYGSAGVSAFLASSLPDVGGPISDVRGWASKLCKLPTEEPQRFVNWPKSPQTRYTLPFSDHRANGVTLICRSEAPDPNFFAAVAHDMLVFVASSSVQEPIWAQFVNSLTQVVPFDWRVGKHIGDPIQLGGFTYTVSSIVPKQQVGTNRYLRKTATKGATFIEVRYTIENTGNETATALAGGLFLRDAQGRTFRQSSEATMAAASDADIDILLSELQPGIPRDQVVVLEVPDATLGRLDLVIPAKGFLESRPPDPRQSKIG